MKKITLSVLMLSFVLVMVSLVGAAITGVAFKTPIANENVSGTFNISWNNSNGHPNMYLQYRAGGCYTGSWTTLIGPFNETVKNYLWSTAARTDGQYCLRLEYSGNETLSGNFTIDNTAPNATFDNTPYSAIVNTAIFINATLVDGNLIKNYTIDFGDNSAVVNADVGSAAGTVNQSHTYNTSGQYTITLTVRDNAGNSVVKTTMIVVNSATPDWIIALSSSSENLISIPFVPNSTSYYSSGSSTHYKNVLGGIVGNLDRVWSYEYDTSSKKNVWKYRKTTSTGWSTAGSLSEIVPGRAYYVFMKSNDVLYGNKKTSSASSSSEPISPPSVKLANEYNLIGMFGNPTNKTVSSVLSSLKSLGGNAYWNSVLDKDETKVSNAANLTAGQGYWISMKHLPDTVTEDYYTYFP